MYTWRSCQQVRRRFSFLTSFVLLNRRFANHVLASRIPLAPASLFALLACAPRVASLGLDLRCASPSRDVIGEITPIIIRYIFSFVFIGRKPTTWPANNCLQIRVLLQIMFCSCTIETTLSCENDRSLPRPVRGGFDNFSWSKEQW